MKKVQQGFTLIELMIVVAIIGILAAIAIPQYQTFIAKSQVSRAVGETGALKTAIEDCYNNGITAVGDPTATTPGCDPQETASSILAGTAWNNTSRTDTIPTGSGTAVVVMNASGVATITGTFGNKASSILKVTPAAVQWTRTADGSWTCLSSAAAKYNTASCPVGTIT